MMPVNHVLVAEGEEESSSPSIRQLVHSPDIVTELREKMREREHVVAPTLHGSGEARMTSATIRGRVRGNGEKFCSPSSGQLMCLPEVEASLRVTIVVFVPMALQGLDGEVTVTLGAKVVVELELVASGEKWGRGP